MARCMHDLGTIALAGGVIKFRCMHHLGTIASVGGGIKFSLRRMGWAEKVMGFAVGNACKVGTR